MLGAPNPRVPSQRGGGLEGPGAAERKVAGAMLVQEIR